MTNLALFCVAISTLCSLLTADNIPVDPKFDPKKLSGKWYPFLTGSYRQQPRENILALSTTPLSNGGFSAKLEKPVGTTCQVIKLDFKPTRPGFFKTEDGKVFIHILETDYTQYLICLFKFGGEDFVQLLAKKPKASEIWKKKFANFARRLGFDVGKVQDFSYADLCATPPKM